MCAPSWKRSIRTLTLVAVATLAACDADLTDPFTDSTSGTGDTEEAAETAAATVEDSWSALVTAEELSVETVDAARSGRAGPEVEDHLVEAGVFAAESEEARSSGADAVADEMDGLLTESYLAAAVDLRGPALVDEAISTAESAVTRVGSALAGGSRPPEVSDRLDEARGALDRARLHRARGRRAAALRAATDAASALRDLSPERRAEALVKTANRLLELAVELAGPEPGERIAAALREAEEECNLAERALDDERWRVAVGHGLRCGRIALRVIAHLGGGIRDDVLSDRAESVVERAARYHEWAVDAAGPEPRPEIQRALDEAARHLADAREALAAGEWRRAVRHARRSAAISRRVIALVTHGPGDRPVIDRLEAAIDSAHDLLERATDLAGSDPEPEVAEKLRQAETLLDEAAEAFRDERWRVAYVKLHRAVGILRGLVARLA